MITISVVHGSAFIWNADDASTVREKHRLIGTLVGCLPRAPRQNSRLGLPLQLLPEEAQLLVEKGLAVLINGSCPAVLPSKEEEEKFKKFRDEDYQEQVTLAREKRQDIVKLRIQQIKEGKKKKRNKILQQRRDKGEEISDSAFEEDVEVDVESLTGPPLDKGNMLVQIFTETPWPKPADTKVEWNFPLNPQEILRYRVFKDLWEKGHYLTTGGKYGGDFLVYPGDPSCFHSFYIARCISHEEKMNTLELSTIMRLGSTVKKTVLLCSVDGKNELSYISLSWTGLS